MSALYLLGKDHADPMQFASLATDDDKLAIAIASVVTKEAKRHSFADNEDVVGVVAEPAYKIMMVADAYYGYVASHEAVLRFPRHFAERFARRTSEPIEQVYLEAVLSLSVELLGVVGLPSGVTYGLDAFQRVITDRSVTQFYSVVIFEGHYYLCGLGNCACHILRSSTLTRVSSESAGMDGFGVLTPYLYMTPDQHTAGREIGSPVKFDDPIVCNGAHVQRLQVLPGDIVLLSSDGLKLDDKITTGRLLQGLFHGKTMQLGLDMILTGVLAIEELRLEMMLAGTVPIEQLSNHDNVAIAAVRV